MCTAIKSNRTFSLSTVLSVPKRATRRCAMCLTEVRGTQAGRRAQNALTKVSLAKVRSTETTINVILLIYIFAQVKHVKNSNRNQVLH